MRPSTFSSATRLVSMILLCVLSMVTPTAGPAGAESPVVEASGVGGYTEPHYTASVGVYAFVGLNRGIGITQARASQFSGGMYSGTRITLVCLGLAVSVQVDTTRTTLTFNCPSFWYRQTYVDGDESLRIGFSSAQFRLEEGDGTPGTGSVRVSSSVLSLVWPDYSIPVEIT